jgi:hypothetical protein
MFLPVWRPDKPSGSGDRRFVFSPKMRRQVAFSSTLESDRWRLLEYDPDVTAFCEQPGVVVDYVDGQWRRSRLDFWVRYVSGREVFEEVKHSSELRDPNSRAQKQIEIQRGGLRALGKEFQVTTELEIWANPILNNSLRTLLHEFDEQYPALVASATPLFVLAKSLVINRPGSSIQFILEQRPQSVPVEVYRMAIFELIRLHVLDGALEKIALSPQSILRPGPKFLLT